jgi:nucleoid DNA-binding protein
MKTTLLLFAALLISTITFSQTTRKGYTYYKNSSDVKMNKAELIDAMAKEANNSKKRVARTGRNPQTGKEIKITPKSAIPSYGSTRSNKQTLNKKNSHTTTKPKTTNKTKKTAKFKAGKAIADELVHS